MTSLVTCWEILDVFGVGSVYVVAAAADVVALAVPFVFVEERATEP